MEEAKRRKSKGSRVLSRRAHFCLTLITILRAWFPIFLPFFCFARIFIRASCPTIQENNSRQFEKNIKIKGENKNSGKVRKPRVFPFTRRNKTPSDVKEEKRKRIGKSEYSNHLCCSDSFTFFFFSVFLEAWSQQTTVRGLATCCSINARAKSGSKLLMKKIIPQFSS